MAEYSTDNREVAGSIPAAATKLNMIEKQRNSKIQGLIGVGKAIEYFTSNGHIISVPLADCQEYDLLVDINGTINKVQVKTALNATKVELRSKSTYTHKEFDNTAIDIVFITTNVGSYCIPAREITAKTGISVSCTKYIKFKI